MPETLSPQHPKEEPLRDARLGYETPSLQRLGDLRALTLGGSIGRGDSGAPTRQSRPGRI